MLTKQDEGLVAGIRGIEWDAVELPSQFMENWCYHRYNLSLKSSFVYTTINVRLSTISENVMGKLFQYFLLKKMK